MIKVNNVCRKYGSGETEVNALSNVTLSIEQNEFVAVMGTSGSGKSTLMNILGCLDTPTSGEYLLDGESIQNIEDEETTDQETTQQIPYSFTLCYS